LQQRKRRRYCRTPYLVGPRRRVHCPPIADDRPKRLVRRYYEDVLGQRRIDVLRRLVGVDFIGHDSGGALMDRMDFFTAVEMLHDGFAQLEVTIEDQVAEGPLVTTRWTAIGRHTGAFAGIEPTGREVMFAGTDIHRLDGGRFAEVWEQTDYAGLLAQLL
jgi:predicted ester cyclase